MNVDVTQREAEPRAHTHDVPARRGGGERTKRTARRIRLSAFAESDHDRRAVKWATDRGGRLAECKPYTDRPPSIAEVVAYVRAGGFVPGNHPWVVELPGYAYGALIAVPVTVVGYSLMWVVQRPSRLALVVFVLLLIAAAW